MIVREWRGLAKKEREADYLDHFRGEVLPILRQLAGFSGATVLRRQSVDGVHITVLTRWTSMDAIRSFAGEHLEVAVVAQAAQSCFHSYDHTVSHYEVVYAEKA
jgi:heme-degrading monooxygenase HmoA